MASMRPVKLHPNPNLTTTAQQKGLKKQNSNSQQTSIWRVVPIHQPKWCIHQHPKWCIHPTLVPVDGIHVHIQWPLVLLGTGINDWSR